MMLTVFNAFAGLPPVKAYVSAIGRIDTIGIAGAYGRDIGAPYKGLRLIALIYNGWVFVIFNCGPNCI